MRTRCRILSSSRDISCRDAACIDGVEIVERSESIVFALRQRVRTASSIVFYFPVVNFTGPFFILATVLFLANGAAADAGWIVEGRVVAIYDGDTITVLDIAAPRSTLCTSSQGDHADAEQGVDARLSEGKTPL